MIATAPALNSESSDTSYKRNLVAEPSMGQRTQQISRILSQRIPLLSKLEKAEEQFNGLLRAITSLDQQKQKLQKREELDGTRQGLQEIDLQQIKENLSSEIRGLEKLKKRFKRETLNIGVVGRARQGKSLLLQSLTGLTATEIPDGSGEHCTGVRSTILHQPNEKTRAVVNFYSEAAFLVERLSPYYEELELGKSPTSLVEFSITDLASLPAHKMDAISKSQYEHLCRYKDQLESYKSLLGADDKTVEASEIRQYVAQDTPDGDRSYYNYLAVREVKIFCPFPEPDTGKVAVIDMPGLGDTGIGDDKRLISTLEQDVDFILFVRKPNPAADTWYETDVQLYEIASQALKSIPIEEWSFMVLNRTDNLNGEGDNSQQCKTLASSINAKGIKTAQILISNCKKNDEVGHEVLDPILDYMLQNISDLDRKYAASFQRKIHEICQSIDFEASRVSSIISLPEDPSNAIEFNERFDKFWSTFAKDLKDMLASLSGSRKKDDKFFSEAVNNALLSCKKEQDIPTKETIEDLHKSKNDWSGTQGELMNEVRNKLSKKFLHIEAGLELSANDLKGEIYAVFAKQSLDNLAPGKQGGDYLDAVVSQIPETCEELKLTFKIMSEFKLLYRGLVQHRIRKHLDVLSPDTTPFRFDHRNGANRFLIAQLRKSEADQVYENLAEAYDGALKDCKCELQKLRSEPSLASFAIAEEFVDRLLYSQGIRGELWKFLFPKRGIVWPEVFRQGEELQVLAKDWNTAIAEVRSKSRSLSLLLVR